MISRVYTVPLKKAWRRKKSRRAEAAMKFLRSFIARHMKTEEEKVKIDNKVNEAVWARSMNNPPRRIRVKADKYDDGTVVVSLLEEGKRVEEKKTEKKEKKAVKKKKEEEAKKGAGEQEKPHEES